MTEVGKWLGKENGKGLIREVARTGATKEQFRAAITTYCILFGVEVDTFEWDELILRLYTDWNIWFENLDDFDNYMAELLV